LRLLKAGDNAERTTDQLVWVIVGTTITLLGMALGALVLMKDGSIQPGLGTIFVILSFAALGLVEGVLLWRLLRLNRVTRFDGALDERDDFSTDGLEPEPAPAALREPPESVSDATEQTTRAIEPSYREGE
jgi:hypothetical protein